jgi:outer membrane protein OmpA-like peptidoglycan-associated protein
MKEAVADTGFRLPRQITWTDDKGKEHIVTEATKDSVTGEYITQMELSEITVVAKSKQVAERNGKINLDFIVTVPGELISNKWQVQLTPVAYKSADTLYLDRIFLSGADFAKMQRKGYMRYQAFMNSIIPDSLYLQKLFDEKGYRKALAELEEEYFQAWKHEVISKERWIDWSDKANARFALFNYRMERNKQAIAGYNSILEYLPAYRLRREMDGKYIPSKWKIFAEGNYKIRTRNITPEDSASITRRFTDYAKMAENRKRKEQAGEMYEKYVRFPYEAARLDTVIKEGDNFVYYYKQELPATENTKKIDLTLDGQILSKDETKTQLPPSDTITYFISSMVQFLDRSPRYKKKIITRKDEVNLRAYVTYKSGATEFSEDIGDNRAEIDKVFETIHGINYTGEFLIDSIRMTATSSPEGSADMNLFLSKGRALALKKYLALRSDDREGVDTLFRPRWIGEDWNRLHELVLADDSLENKAYLLRIMKETDNPDNREYALRKYPADYMRIRGKHYPLLRGVEFKFHLHRRNMLQDTIVMPVIDTTYMQAVKMIEDRQYRQALAILDVSYPDDYNTAVCLMSLGYDKRALEIMTEQADTSDRNYLLAILYSRLKREEDALKMYVKSCDQDASKIWRGKLDPEINKLIVTYNLYKDELY